MQIQSNVVFTENNFFHAARFFVVELNSPSLVFFEKMSVVKHEIVIFYKGTIQAQALIQRTLVLKSFKDSVAERKNFFRDINWPGPENGFPPILIP